MQNRYRPQRTAQEWLQPSADLTAMLRQLGLHGGNTQGAIGRFADSPKLDGVPMSKLAPAAWHHGRREVIVDARQAVPGQSPDQVRLLDRSWQRRNGVALGLIVHEMGHAAYTPRWFGELRKRVAQEVCPAAEQLLTVAEECRMERQIFSLGQTDARGRRGEGEGYQRPIRQAVERLILRELQPEQGSATSALLVLGRWQEYGGCLHWDDQVGRTAAAMESRGISWGKMGHVYYRHWGQLTGCVDDWDGMPMEWRVDRVREFWQDWKENVLGEAQPPESPESADGSQGESGSPDSGAEAAQGEAGQGDQEQEGDDQGDGDGDQGDDQGDGQSSGMKGDTAEQESDSGDGQSSGDGESDESGESGEAGDSGQSDDPADQGRDDDFAEQLAQELRGMAADQEERAADEAEQLDKQEAKDDQRRAKTALMASGPIGRNAMPEVTDEQLPAAADRRFAQHLSDVMKRIQTPDVRKRKHQEQLPPGRYHGRGAVQRDAEIAQTGWSNTPAWKRQRKTTVRVPPPVIGVMVDISSSMTAGTMPMATVLWGFAEAARSVNAKFAAAHYGYRGKLYQHQPARKAIVPAAHGTENFQEAFGLLDSRLHLTDREDRARLLIIVSDGSYGAPGQKDTCAAVIRHLERVGVTVLWVQVPGTHTPRVAGTGIADPLYGGSLVQMDAPTPQEQARQVGQAVEAALERDAARRTGGGW